MMRCRPVSSADRKSIFSSADFLAVDRYQRVISPDCLPLSNGRKPSMRACDDSDANGRVVSNYSSFDSKQPRNRSSTQGSAATACNTPDRSPFPHYPDSAVSSDHHHESSSSGNGNGNVLLRWGHKKRSRGSRAAADESSSGGRSRRNAVKIQRRDVSSAAGGAEKLAAAFAMPPPGGASYVRGANLRPCGTVRDATSPLINRAVEERSSGCKRSPPRLESSADQEEKETPTGSGGGGGGEKVVEWPRIYLSLSRKEKEDDFLAMKGTKLPQRPKKRAKNVDKNIQYCFPGMWLSDLTRGRYEVREKKCVKKKRRGLKGMENIDSDSE